MDNYVNQCRIVFVSYNSYNTERTREIAIYVHYEGEPVLSLMIQKQSKNIQRANDKLSKGPSHNGEELININCT